MARLMRVLPVGPLQCNAIVLVDGDSGEAVVVDPGGEAERILATVAELGGRCTVIVNTHAHFDHVGANAELRRATGARLLMHADDLPLYADLQGQTAWLGGMIPTPERTPVDGTLAHGDTVTVGTLKATVLHTPGHTPGGICLLFEDDPPLLLAGDTLFAGGIGRTDLPGGNDKALADSLARRVLPLDDRTQVVPGHGPMTTIGRERRDNPFLAELVQ